MFGQIRTNVLIPIIISLDGHGHTPLGVSSVRTDIGWVLGVLAPLIKQLTEAALEAELDSHLADDFVPNRKNGKSGKTIKTSEGKIDLDTPRDRAGTFEPQIIQKHQSSVSDEIESKILSMYGRGLSYSDIREHVQEIYGISVSTAAISAITDKIIDTVKVWQQRPLNSHYPFVWLDAIHYKVRAQGHYQSRAVYTVAGLKPKGSQGGAGPVSG
jgi:transposase-like protein